MQRFLRLSLLLYLLMIYAINNNKNSGRFIASAIGGIIGLIIGLIFFGAKPTIAIMVLVGSLLGLIYKTKKTN